MNGQARRGMAYAFHKTYNGRQKENLEVYLYFFYQLRSGYSGRPRKIDNFADIRKFVKPPSPVITHNHYVSIVMQDIVAFELK